MGTQVYAESDCEDVYVVGAEGNGKKAAIITYYAENDNKWQKYITIDLGSNEFDGARVCVVDETRTMNEYTWSKIENGKITIFAERNSIFYIEV